MKQDETEEYQDRLAEDTKEQKQKKGRRQHFYRLAISILILTGFLEDFPVIIVMFYIAVTRICGAPARQEVGSALTMATIISAMLNSLWTMIILFCELCSCQKLFKDLSTCCCNRKSPSSFKNLCKKSCYDNSNLKPSKHC